MDALLRYIIYQIAHTLLLFEVILMLFFALAIIAIKLTSRAIARRRVTIQDQIRHIIEASLFNGCPIDTMEIPKELCQFRNLVEVLEKYDHLFNDPLWIQIKKKVVSKYLASRLESYASSLSWFNRQLAGRCLLLCPMVANEPLLEKLLNDPRYLVRVTAAVCIIQISDKDLFYKVIYKMSKETSLSQFPYRDALIQVSEEKYHWIESLLASASDKSVIVICLDILSTRYSKDLLPLIKPYINDIDPTCRIFAIKALGNMPSPEAIELLISRLADSDWKIRGEAIMSLQKLYAKQAIPRLQPLLNDPVWWVRLQAALTLKALGQEGMEVLVAQSKDKEPLAYEIAQYSLALPT